MKQKVVEKFYKVKPVEFLPIVVEGFHSFQTVIKVITVNIYCNLFHNGGKGTDISFKFDDIVKKKATTAEWLSYSTNASRGAFMGAKIKSLFFISKFYRGIFFRELKPHGKRSDSVNYFVMQERMQEEHWH